MRIAEANYVIRGKQKPSMQAGTRRLANQNSFLPVFSSIEIGRGWRKQRSIVKMRVKYQHK